MTYSGGKSGEEDDTVADLLDDTQDTDDTQVGCDQTVDADCDGVPDEDDCDPNDGLVYPGAVRYLTMVRTTTVLVTVTSMMSMGMALLV